MKWKNWLNLTVVAAFLYHGVRNLSATPVVSFHTQHHSDALGSYAYLSPLDSCCWSLYASFTPKVYPINIQLNEILNLQHLIISMHFNVLDKVYNWMKDILICTIY